MQILGGLGDPSVQSHATQLTTRLALLTGAEAQLLPAQGVVSSSAARLVMLGDVYVRAAMDQFRRMTIAFVGIGALQPSVMLANSGNAFTKEELQDLAQRGAVGDISLRFFDRNGAPVHGPLDERVIGVTLEELKTTARVVGVAGGDRKVEAIRELPHRRLRQCARHRQVHGGETALSRSTTPWRDKNVTIFRQDRRRHRREPGHRRRAGAPVRA